MDPVSWRICFTSPPASVALRALTGTRQKRTWAPGWVHSPWHGAASPAFQVRLSCVRAPFVPPRSCALSSGVRGKRAL